MPHVVLASQSETRAKLLRAAGVELTQQAALIDEASVREALQAEGVSGLDAAVILAELKAEQVARRVGGEAIVLGSDQILDLDGAWLEKPGSRAAARAQLLSLRGRRHRLLSAVVAFREGTRIWHHVESAEISLRNFSEPFLDAYLDAAGEAVQHSVGAYHLEGLGAQLMTGVKGDFFTVLGLPLLPTLQFLRDQKVLPL